MNYVTSLLSVLDEPQLLRIAKLFDPSRPAAKTLLMKFSTTPRRQRWSIKMLYLALYGSSARILVHVSFTSVPRIPAAMCSCLIIISSQLLGT